MFFKHCPTCKKFRFRLKKQKIKFPTGGFITSQKEICKDCARVAEAITRIK